MGKEKMKKIIIFGENAVGKTSIVRTSCYGVNFDYTQKLTPTKGVSIENFDYRQLEEVNIWDCGGQEKYIQKHLTDTGKMRIFSEVDGAVYVMDASREETMKSDLLKEFLDIILEFNPKLEKIYLFINKMDIAPIDINDRIMKLMKDILSYWEGGMVEFVSCSVKKGSAQKEFTRVIDSLVLRDQDVMEKMDFFNECLKEFYEIVDADFRLIDSVSKLPVAEFINFERLDLVKRGKEIVDDPPFQDMKNGDFFIHRDGDISNIVFPISEKVYLVVTTDQFKDGKLKRVARQIETSRIYSDLTKIFS